MIAATTTIAAATTERTGLEGAGLRARFFLFFTDSRGAREHALFRGRGHRGRRRAVQALPPYAGCPALARARGGIARVPRKPRSFFASTRNA